MDRKKINLIRGCFCIGEVEKADIEGICSELVRHEGELTEDASNSLLFLDGISNDSLCGYLPKLYRDRDAKFKLVVEAMKEQKRTDYFSCIVSFWDEASVECFLRYSPLEKYDFNQLLSEITGEAERIAKDAGLQLLLGAFHNGQVSDQKEIQLPHFVFVFGKERPKRVMTRNRSEKP